MIYLFWEDIIKMIEKEDILVFLQEVKVYYDLYDENEEVVCLFIGKNYLLCKGYWYSRGENYVYLNLLQEMFWYEIFVVNFWNLFIQEFLDLVMFFYLLEFFFKIDEQLIDIGFFIQVEQFVCFVLVDVDVLLFFDLKKMFEYFWVEEIDGDIQFVKYDYVIVVMLKFDIVFMDIVFELKFVVVEKWVKFLKVLSNYNEYLLMDDFLLLCIV